MKSFLLFLLLVTSPWILAQEDENTATDDNIVDENEEVIEQTEITSDESDNEEPVAGNDDVDFVPSIQISEDLSVSFPVDI